MHVEIRGAGPPLVLLHGWAMHGGIFAPFAERLAQQRTLHLVDLPGHGHSAPRQGAFNRDALLDQLFAELPPAPWLGWSLGGLIAMQAALRAPERVASLVLLCASPRFVRGADWPHAVEREVFAQFEAGLRQDYRATIDRFLALEAHGSDHMREELRTLRAEVYARGEPARHALEDGLHVLESEDLLTGLPQLAVPSLWIAGRRDRLVPWQGMQAAAGLCPGGRFLRIDGGGHAPFLSHADEVAEAVLAFIG
ncbi:pimeloyl-ACP methyl ester esterase BioH [Pseudomarimonas salicorniae]|uniref:Pimeloyl-[acyl-carrier protein] methyl ester esterase n=1 Tax=Pseudomarimonas salicorniae TaxID=2933270 RepID=A0ABT0GKZ5_9GAMM|nr:pimeloyl-ACP methyl ester esterase BioH [Lysobacter sp. CAU 1642]MCK7595052.1 pimeloyl-ACP methyl ester esterase BioH [Lysobacter sp. CAU 1642]